MGNGGVCPLSNNELDYTKRHGGADPRPFPHGPLAPLISPVPADSPPEVASLRSRIVERAGPLSRRLNIMFCGLERVGKSALINSFASALSGGENNVTITTHGTRHGTQLFHFYHDVLRIPRTGRAAPLAFPPLEDAFGTPFRPPLAFIDTPGIPPHYASEAAVRTFRDNVKAAVLGQLPDGSKLLDECAHKQPNKVRAVHAIVLVHEIMESGLRDFPALAQGIFEARDALKHENDFELPIIPVLTHLDNKSEQQIKETKEHFARETGFGVDDMLTVRNFLKTEASDPAFVHGPVALELLRALNQITQTAEIVARKLSAPSS